MMQTIGTIYLAAAAAIAIHLTAVHRRRRRAAIIRSKRHHPTHDGGAGCAFHPPSVCPPKRQHAETTVTVWKRR